MLPEAQEAEREVVLSVVVPTHNAGEIVVTLAQRIANALENIPYELIFADDSDDDTPQILMRLATSDKRIHLLHRKQFERAGSLATAIVTGIRQSCGAYISVLHGDLQHPPELIPKLLAAAEEADIVVASRFLPGEESKDLHGSHRKLASQRGRAIARTLFRRVRPCTDPLSDFFIFRREVIQRVKLRLVGEHILLEILVRGRWTRLIEVPYQAARYTQDQGKASANGEKILPRHLRALLFQGEWGRGPVQYRRLGKEALLHPTSTPEAPAAEAVEQAGEVSAPAWRQIAVQATGIWLVSRAMLALLTYFAALFQANLTSKNPVLTPDILLGKWSQWDATNYLFIAQSGYSGSTGRILTAFFPLYPFLTHLLTALIGGPGHELLAGMIISNLLLCSSKQGH